MPTLAAIALTWWLCALLAIPRRPRAGQEMQELVYRRLVARQQWMMACAVLATAVAALVLLTAA
jgi:hypothetical protein